MEHCHSARGNICCGVESVRGDIWCETREACVDATEAGGRLCQCDPRHDSFPARAASLCGLL